MVEDGRQRWQKDRSTHRQTPEHAKSTTPKGTRRRVEVLRSIPGRTYRPLAMHDSPSRLYHTTESGGESQTPAFSRLGFPCEQK
ncbi:hypothetical protein EVAR_64507_1 [Eumeta japonica]|uniref:Uncharacterized protein n=1 Tax=Eumeta variegata TaxID=151549 RepID=A0A4C1YZQ2_EUMVA|nr:hypothetical protein EVAR_64507_1 [Eumeta japonica]